jgi:hypothetical protein
MEAYPAAMYLTLEPWVHLRTMKAHPGVFEAHSGVVKAHMGAVEVHL